MTLEFWRNLSVIWLALLCMIGMAIPLAVSVFAVKGMHILVDRTPALLGKGRQASAQMRSLAARGSDRVAAPVIAAHRTTTRVGAVLQRLARRRAPVGAQGHNPTGQDHSGSRKGRHL